MKKGSQKRNACFLKKTITGSYQSYFFVDITDRIIAMGYPAEGFERFFRNDMNDIKGFLDEHHKDAYKVCGLYFFFGILF